MALRGWRLFGVAGTIFIYVTGILLLSLMSIQHPEQRRLRRTYQESDPLKTHELGIINRKPPLQWCTKLRFLDNDGDGDRTIQQQKRFQTFPGHYVKKRIAPNPHNRNYVISHPDHENNSHGAPDAKTSDLKRFDDSYKSAEQQDEHENAIDNEIYKFQTEPWPSGAKYDKKLYNRYKNDANGLTALVSFPGSGNTWLRYLLQQSTGILTGSVYKDYGLLKSGFPAESISNSSVLVIKTHEWGPNAWAPFSKAILLVRDPKKAILAEFNRQSGGHVGFASPDRYKRTKGRYWNQFVANKLWAWEQTNLAWARNFTGDTLVVYYDKLVDDVEGTLRAILNFINFPVDEDLLSCAILRQEGIYRRKKRIMPFDPFTPAMHVVIDEKRTEVYGALGREI
ncbi:WSCD family member AAEL009094 [Culicoides brevitarsis]|uniref:WSCD family member AAEL009094 n=1 Tax=Culicoides brevitarsis TaxID=469753 RepID=UPI00307BB37C